MATLFLIAVILALAFAAFVMYLLPEPEILTPRRASKARQFLVGTFISPEGKVMERYKHTWVPSPDNPSTLASQKIVASVSGGAETDITPVGFSSPDIPVGTSSVEIDWTAGAAVSYDILTFGTNGLFSRMASPVVFTPQAPVAPSAASGAAQVWEKTV